MRKKCFINPHVKMMRRGFKDYLLWKIGYYDEEHRAEKISRENLFSSHKHSFQENKPKVIWINHSTFLISVGNVNFLTDPIWSERCSPVPFLGPKRRHPPGIALSELPKIDFVLISHDHYDHLDKKTVLNLSLMFPHLSWFVPKGVKRWFDRHKISPVYEFAWWEEREFSLAGHQGIRGKISAVPAQHFSGRSGFDLNATLWAGWLVEITSLVKDHLETKRCYYAGDTGYNPFDFKKIEEKFPLIDLSLIPIGCYTPRPFMEAVHINPQEAVRIHQEVGSRLSIGMHWKTFQLSDEPVDRPPYDLYQSLIKENVDPSKFIVIEPGHAINW